MNKETRVVNKYKEPYDIYIGREVSGETLLHTYQIRKLRLISLLTVEMKLLQVIVSGL